MKPFKSAPLPKDNNCIREVHFFCPLILKKNTILDCQNPKCMSTM